MSPISTPSNDPYYRPVIPVTLALMAGMVLADGLPGMGLIALVLLLVAVVWLIRCLRREQSARWSPLLAAMAAGYLAMLPYVSLPYGSNHLVDYLDTGYWRIQGTVVDQPLVRYGRTRVILEVERLSHEEDMRSVRGRIRLTIMGVATLNPGDRLTFPAKIRSFSNFKNPGGFDYRRHMAFKGIHGSAWVPAEKLQRDERTDRSWTTGLIHGVRQRLSRLIDAAARRNEADEKAVLKALVYGDRSGIDDNLRERFNRSGVGHLLAISGLHVGIVASVVFGSLCWIFSFSQPLLWRGWGRGWAAALTLAPVLAYGWLAGWTPSTQRAEMMVALFLAALILGRTHDTLNTLAVAALVILIVFPPAIFSISFQLSFAAVLTIVCGLERIGGSRERNDRPTVRVVGWLKGAVLVSALAIAGTTPVVLLHFNQTSLVGMAANVFLVPLVGFVV
ncbi:MAG: ComEC/Rec2 family competence protein, partial [Desulfosarcina sp.]